MTVKKQYRFVFKKLAKGIKLVLDIADIHKIPTMFSVVYEKEEGDYIISCTYLYRYDGDPEEELVGTFIRNVYGSDSTFLFFTESDFSKFNNNYIPGFSITDNNYIEKRIRFVNYNMTLRESLAAIYHVFRSIDNYQIKYIRLIYNDNEFWVHVAIRDTYSHPIHRHIDVIKEVFQNFIHQGIASGLNSTDQFVTT